MFKWLLVGLMMSSMAVAHEADELTAADARWNTLRQSGDSKALSRLLVDDWQLTHSDGRVQDKRDYLDELASGRRRNQHIENTDVQVRRYGDSAVVTGTSIQSGSSDGQAWHGRFRFTRTWVRIDGEWRMAASHSSRIADSD